MKERECKRENVRERNVRKRERERERQRDGKKREIRRIINHHTKTKNEIEELSEKVTVRRQHRC